MANYHFYCKVMGNKTEWESISKIKWFRTKSLFIIILCFFISDSLSVNTSTVLPLLTRLNVLIITSKSKLCGKEK